MPVAGAGCSFCHANCDCMQGMLAVASGAMILVYRNDNDDCSADGMAYIGLGALGTDIQHVEV
jgi:hypothetical protein